MKKIIGIIALTLLGTSIFAQREETLMGDTGWGFSGAWGGWVNNVSNFNENYSGYGGTMWNLEFGKRLTIGYSHYTMTAKPLSATNNFNLRSRNFNIGYTPLAYRALHPIFNVGIGSGKLRLANEGEEDRVYTFHPSGGLEFNVTRWCHIDGQIGYRIVSDTNFARYKDADFSGLYGQLNLKFGFSWGRYKTNRKEKN